MENEGFKGLQVYKKAYALCIQIHEMSRGFPREERYELASQIRRASTSVPLNIAEGQERRESKGDYRRFIQIARGSCAEMRVLLDMAKDFGYIDEAVREKYYAGYEEINRMLIGLQRYVENRK